MAGSRPGRWLVLALAATVAAGAALRLERGGRGLPYLHHWDEPFLVHRAIAMVETGDPNPRFFNYGSLRIYLDVAAVRLAAAHLGRLPAAHPERLDRDHPVRFRGAVEDSLRREPRGLPPWWISHPSFFRACRALSALYGALAIALVALLARRLDGGAAAAGAALLLAFDPEHLRHSATATVDVLATTTALLALVATQRFLDLEDRKALTLAFLAVGWTASAKYNIALVAVAPITALVLVRRRDPGARWGRWLLGGPLLAAASFAATSPFLLLDFTAGARDLRHIARAYLGDAPRAIAPGWPHLVADLAELVGNLSLPVVALVVVGLLELAMRRRGATIFAAGLALLALNASTRADFHRNLLPLYALAAVAGGVGLAAAARRLAALVAPRAAGRARLERAATALLLAGAALALGARAVDRVRSATREPPRSRALAELAQLAGPDRGEVTVAAELAIHPVDRARWPGRLVERPLAEIVCAPEPGALALVPLAVAAAGEAELARARRLDRALGALGATLWRAGRAPLWLDRPSAFAGVALRRPPRSTPDVELCAPPAHPGGAPPRTPR